MKAKKWLLIYLSLSLVIMIGVILLNYQIDSYAVFRNDYSQLYREPNQNYLKMEFLLEKKHSYDSFIFGSSRVGKIDPEIIPNGKYYNMTYSEGVPKEHAENIQTLLDEDVKIKHVLLGLDEFSYHIDPISHTTQLLRCPHYLTDLNRQSRFEFLFKYLAVWPSSFDIKRLFKQYLFNDVYDVYEYDIYRTGLPIVPGTVERAIEADIEGHLKSEKFNYPTKFKGRRIEQTLEDIKKIISLSRKYTFELIVFINPIHKVTYLNTDFEDFQYFKRELVKLTPYFDFSGLNDITTNNYYYYDTSHYRTIVGKMIVDQIFNNKQDGDSNFGKWVDTSNIAFHLQTQRLEVERDNALYTDRKANSRDRIF